MQKVNDKDEENKKNEFNTLNQEEGEKEINENSQVRLLQGFSLLEGACLYLRRSIVNLTASADKERLLFYIDQLIAMDILSNLTEAQRIIASMKSIVENSYVTREIRHHLIYLHDIFNDVLEQIQEMKSLTDSHIA